MLLRDAVQRTLVRFYGAAKSHQDVEAALSVCHPEFRIDTAPFGIETADRDDTAAQLGFFVSVFPDYRALSEGLASDADGCAWWGRISLSFGGPLLGHAPTGRHAELPAVSVFTFRDGAWYEASSGARFDPEAGGFAGKEATPLNGFDTFWFNWSMTHPNTRVLKRAKRR